MRNILLLITVLLLVSCNKEEKQIYGTWTVYEAYSRSTNQEQWKLATWQSPDCKITKTSWEPYIESSCKTSDGLIVLDVPNGNTYSYVYYEDKDEIEFDIINSNGVHCWKRLLKRI